MNEETLSKKILSGMVEVSLLRPENFKILTETLSRVGILDSEREKTLIPQCYVLHKRGRYYIAHYRELMALDGVNGGPLHEKDVEFRNGVCHLLVDWGLVEIRDPEQIADPFPEDIDDLYVLPHSKKKGWLIEHAYHIGKTQGVVK